MASLEWTMLQLHSETIQKPCDPSSTMIIIWIIPLKKWVFRCIYYVFGWIIIHDESYWIILMLHTMSRWWSSMRPQLPPGRAGRTPRGRSCSRHPDLGCAAHSAEGVALRRWMARKVSGFVGWLACFLKKTIAGWWLSPIPLKNMNSSIGMMTIPNIWKKNVPNHQSDSVMI